MKVVILCGGKGTRMGEISQFIPKPMSRIDDDEPVLWHIMKTFAHHGHKDFVLCLGWLGSSIRDYFLNHHVHHGAVRLSPAAGAPSIELLEDESLDWTVTMVDTGMNTQTGGRLGRIRKYVGDEPFMVTYGDGVADIDVAALVAFHESHGKTATITGVHPASRFGELKTENGQVTVFEEKPQTTSGLINGGYMVFSPNIWNYLSTDESLILERAPLQRLAADGELMAYEHEGYWRCMDTRRDHDSLSQEWREGRAPWKVWE